MAVVMGVVRHAVNRSAGYNGFIGRISFARQAASTIVGPSIVYCTLPLVLGLPEGGGELGLFPPDFKATLSTKWEINTPAAEQSNT